MDRLAAIVMMPWIMNKHFTKFRETLDELLQALQKYLSFLSKQKEKSNANHQSSEPVRGFTDNWSFKIVDSTPKVSPKYNVLVRALELAEEYKPIDLIDFEPEERFERRSWIENLRLPFAVGLFSFHHGNYLGNLTIVWKQPPHSERDSTRDIENINEIKSKLTKFATRAMRKEFMEKYAKTCKEKPAILRSMYKYLTGYSIAPTNRAEEAVDLRVSKFLLDSDDPKLILDLRKNNGRVEDPKFEPFWDEAKKYFDEKSVVHERRHTEIVYMPFAVSVRDFRQQILSRMPENSVAPSESWIRLNFYPSNSYVNAAAQYTGRFQVKRAVQQRLLRVQHEDADYAFYQYTLLKNFAVKWRDHCHMQCLDDKAIVPVGDPGKPMTAVSRSHHSGLTSGERNQLLCVDHDYHLCGIVPSVCLTVEIPDTPRGSFYHGDVHVTLKDKIFQPSSPFRHSTETVGLVRQFCSDDDVNSRKPILVRYTDGGPDHRPTYTSVQIASILEFIALDLDMFVACRTAPHQSFNNPAERVMSLLNLGLQNVSLSRPEMDAGFELQMKSLSSMSAVRNSRNESLKSALKDSVGTTIGHVKEILSRLQRSNGEVILHDACTEADINRLCEVIRVLSDSIEAEQVLELKKIDGHPDLVNFFKRHCRQRQYSFQVFN